MGLYNTNMTVTHL